MYQHYKRTRNQAIENPFSRVGESYKDAKAPKKISYLQFDEVPVFMDSVLEHYPDWYDFFAVAIYVGLREGEIKGLRWCDIQLGDEETLVLKPFIGVCRSVTQQGQIKGTKTGKDRNVPIAPELLPLLKARKQKMLSAWIKAGKDEADFSDSLVFHNAEGKPIDSANMKQRVFRPALDKAELVRIGFHSLRHTFASLLLQRGVRLIDVQNWLGHASIKMTADVYGHLEQNTNSESLGLLPKLKGEKRKSKVLKLKGKNAK